MDEIELKLQVSAASADLIEASQLLPGKPRPVKQRSIYFDTPDRALAAAGMSLRIRQIKKRRIQTSKTAGASAAGLFERPEWEIPVKGDVPVIDDTTPIQSLLGSKAGDLTQMFEVDMSRRTWNITEGDTAIEVVAERGTISAGDRHTSVCEMELELKSGSPEALFELARKLDNAAPVRLGVMTKAERCYLLAQALRGSVKSGRVPLAPGMTAAEAFQRIIQACIRQFRLNEDLLLPARAPEPLHQARVALRRMRSAFTIFKPVLGANAAGDLREGLRQLAGELGPARDLDVLLQRAKPGQLRDRLRAEREAAYDRVEEVLGSASSRSLMLDLIEWVHSGPWLTDPAAGEARNLPAREFAADALSRFRRKVKKGGRDLENAEDETRHDLRKHAKKLRYAAEFFVPLFDGKGEKSSQKKFSAAPEEVQDQLGALNDLSTAPHVLERLGIGGDPEASKLLAGGKKKPLIAAAADSHGTLIKADRYWR